MLHQLWRNSPPLTATGLLMLVVLTGTLVGLVVDPRIISGAPAWLKPAKFAASIAIFTLTLAWVFGHLPAWTRTRRVVGWVTAITLGGEIIIIAVQAHRGTTSHFNVSTALDGALWVAMGAAITVQTLSTFVVGAALWRQRFDDRALGWALRLGMAITLVGAMAGGLMTRPTAPQLDAARAGEGLPVVGAHTVGAPDGGPGLPGTGWSTRHGDLRVPHFIGLHALQALPIFALILRRRRLSEAAQVRAVLTASASYISLFGLLLWQALRGQSLVAPDGTMLTLLALWGLVTAGALVLALGTDRDVQNPEPGMQTVKSGLG